MCCLDDAELGSNAWGIPVTRLLVSAPFYTSACARCLSCTCVFKLIHLPTDHVRTKFCYTFCSYGGVVVAKLPFEPWPFFQKITHRGLAGSNASDAALVQLPSTPCKRLHLQLQPCSMHVSVLTAALQPVQLDD
jgi:hypothetical protein